MFEPRTRAQLRDLFLASLSSRYAARGVTLYTGEGGDAWMLAESLAIPLEGLYLRALQLTRQILPDQAETEFLDRHGAVEGVTREAATSATLTVRVTGANTTSYTVTGKTLNSAAGLKFTPVNSSGNALTSVTTNGSGYVDILAKCDRAGVVGNLAGGSTLTWSSAPTGMGSTGTVQGSPSVYGADEEADATYAARILARRQERPGSGNRADWRAWCEAVDGVEQAYVYPCYDANAGEGQLPGNVTVVILGPAPSDPDTVSTPRLLSGAVEALCATYVEGTTDASGAAVAEASRVQLRPAAIMPASYTIQAPPTTTVDVVLEITESAAKAFPWAGSFVIYDTGTTAAAPKVTGDATALVGLEVLFEVGAGTRGQFEKRKVSTAVLAAGKTTLTLETALSTAPVSVSTVYPAPPNWTEIRLAIFSAFDRLGPGDVDHGPYPDSARWPSEEQSGRATLYRSALAAEVIQARDANGSLTAGVSGVLAATVTTPASDTVPDPLKLLVLGKLTIVQA